MPHESFAETLQRSATQLRPGDLDATLAQVTRTATEVLDGVDYASITVLHDDGLMDTLAETDPVLLDLDRRQQELAQGPCYAAARDEAPVVSSRLDEDDRFPDYAVHASAAGIRAQAGLPLFDAPTSKGALNLYSTTEGVLESVAQTAALFATQAAVALSYAREVTNLRTALETRQVIGQAVGVVMERYRLSPEGAFAFLARISQTRNVKLRRVAEEVLAEL